MKRLLLALNLLAALAIGVAWLVLPASDTQRPTSDLTADEVRGIEKHITERVEAEFGREEVVTTDAGDCSDLFDLCFASTTVSPREFAKFSRTVFDAGFDLEEANCQPVGCDAVWRSDNATVVIITFPDDFPGVVSADEPLMMVGITPRS